MIKIKVLNKLLREQHEKSQILLKDLLMKLKEHEKKVWIFFDTETLGFDPNNRQLTEIAAIAVNPDFSRKQPPELENFHVKVKLTDETEKLLQQPFIPTSKGDKSPKEILDMTQYFSSTGIEMDEKTALSAFINYIHKQEKKGEVLLVAHNAQFDRKFVSVRSKKYGIQKLENRTMDTLKLLYDFYYPLLLVSDKAGILEKIKSKGRVSFTLGSITAALNIDNKNWHSAYADVSALISVTQQVINNLEANKELNVRSGVEASISLQRDRKKFLNKKK